MTFEENWGFKHKANLNLHKGCPVDINEACSGSWWNWVQFFNLRHLGKKNAFNVNQNKEEKKRPTLLQKQAQSVFYVHQPERCFQWGKN